MTHLAIAQSPFTVERIPGVGPSTIEGAIRAENNGVGPVASRTDLLGRPCQGLGEYGEMPRIQFSS